MFKVISNHQSPKEEIHREWKNVSEVNDRVFNIFNQLDHKDEYVCNLWNLYLSNRILYEHFEFELSDIKFDENFIKHNYINKLSYWLDCFIELEKLCFKKSLHQNDIICNKNDIGDDVQKENEVTKKPKKIRHADKNRTKEQLPDPEKAPNAPINRQMKPKTITLSAEFKEALESFADRNNMKVSHLIEDVLSVHIGFK